MASSASIVEVVEAERAFREEVRFHLDANPDIVESLTADAAERVNASRTVPLDVVRQAMAAKDTLLEDEIRELLARQPLVNLEHDAYREALGRKVNIRKAGINRFGVFKMGVDLKTGAQREESLHPFSPDVSFGDIALTRVKNHAEFVAETPPTNKNVVAYIKGTENNITSGREYLKTTVVIKNNTEHDLNVMCTLIINSPRAFNLSVYSEKFHDPVPPSGGVLEYGIWVPCEKASRKLSAMNGMVTIFVT